MDTEPSVGFLIKNITLPNFPDVPFNIVEVKFDDDSNTVVFEVDTVNEEQRIILDLKPFQEDLRLLLQEVSNRMYELAKELATAADNPMLDVPI